MPEPISIVTVSAYILLRFYMDRRYSTARPERPSRLPVDLFIISKLLG